MKKFFAYLLLAAIAAIFVSFLSGCSTFNKQQRQFVAFSDKYPNELAKLCAQNFPIRERFIPGQTVVTHDTTTIAGPQVPCPPDSKGKIVYIKCPPNKNINSNKVRTDTIYLENTARVALLSSQVVTLGMQNEDFTKQLKQVKSTAETRLFIIITLLILFIASIYINIRNLFKI